MRTKRFFSFFLVVFLVFSLIIPFAYATDYNFGKTTAGATTNNDAFYMFYAYAQAISGSGLGVSISWYMEQYGAEVANYSYALYYSNKTFLAKTGFGVVSTGGAGWKTLNFDAQPTISNASYYFIAVCSNASLKRYKDTGATIWLGWGGSYTGVWADPMNVVGGNWTSEFSAYCTYTVGAVAQNVTFTQAENIYPSAYNLLGKELAFQTSHSIFPSGTGYFWKAIGFQPSNTLTLWDSSTMNKAIASLLTEFLSGGILQVYAEPYFNKELSFINSELIKLWDSGTSAISLIVTTFENCGTIIITASSTLGTIMSATIGMALAIGVLALVLSICGISMVFLRRRRA